MPIFTPAELVRLFVGGLLLGLAFAAGYDVLRIIRTLMSAACIDSRLPLPPTVRRRLRPGRWQDVLVNLEDIAYCLTVGAVIAVYLAAESHSLIRWPFAAGLILGFTLWRLTAGRMLMAASSAIAALLYFALSWLLWAISRPMVGLGRLVVRGMHALADAIRLPIYTRRTMKRFRHQLATTFSATERRDEP